MFSNWKNMVPSLRKQSLLTGRPSSITEMMNEFWRKPFPDVTTIPFAKAELPGLDAKDVEITLRDNVLTIQGEKKFEDEEKKDNYHRIERSYGSFYRTISLPGNVNEDDVKAKFEKGVLTITMSKSEQEKGEKIEIES
jgi:HSP20 family protein